MGEHPHRQGDGRVCGATTVVVGQHAVKIAGQLWAVEGDPNTDGDGDLIASQSFFKINGKPVILNGDAAAADALCPVVGGDHCSPGAVPEAAAAASFVRVTKK